MRATSSPHRTSGTWPGAVVHSWSYRILVLVLIICGCVPSFSAPDSSSHVFHFVPGQEFAAGSLHRFLFGDLWRDAWTAEAGAEIINPDSLAGGLVPSTHPQDSSALLLRGVNGIVYKFHPLTKDPNSILPVELRRTFVEKVARDLVASVHPFASLVAAPLMRSVGLAAPFPRLVVLGDRTQHDRFGPAFAGRPGFLEEATPDSGRLKTPELLSILDSDNRNQVDVVEYLKTRIMDLYLGDWDRGPDRWAWLRSADGPSSLWRPVATGRPGAFPRYDGVALSATEVVIPHLVGCTEEYPSIANLMWEGRHLDRRFLAPINRPVWDSLAAFVVSQLTDSVLDDAVRRLPYADGTGDSEGFRRLLGCRRDGLRDAVDEYHRELSEVVDLWLSDGSETATIGPGKGSALVVEAHARDGTGTPSLERQLFRRVISPDETDEVRVYTGSGVDSIEIMREADSSIPVRVVSGPLAGTEKTYGSTVEDRGASWGLEAIVDWLPQLGPIAGAGPVYTKYGFRSEPYACRLSLVGGYAPVANVGKLAFTSDFRSLIRGTSVTVAGLVSGYELVSYYGPGNERRLDRDPNGDYYRLRQIQTRVDVGIRVPASGAFSLSGGAAYRYVRTRPDGERFVSITRPFGSEDLAFATVSAGVRVDTRDLAVHPLGGILLEVGGAFSPKALSLGESFGKIRGEIRWFVTADTDNVLTISLRCAGERVWGKYPYFEAALLGGVGSLRGYQQARFAGDASLLASVEARVRLGKVGVVVPTTVGMLAFAETGRVYALGGSSRLWHPGVGGGLWAAPWNRETTVSGWIALSDESTLISFSVGFDF